MTWPDGDRYEGHWTNDLMDGVGRYVHADGSVYEGLFKAGKKHGRGRQSQKKGSVEGEWKDGELIKSCCLQ
jgi:hypothetical protein